MGTDPFGSAQGRPERRGGAIRHGRRPCGPQSRVTHAAHTCRAIARAVREYAARRAAGGPNAINPWGSACRQAGLGDGSPRTSGPHVPPPTQNPEAPEKNRREDVGEAGAPVRSGGQRCRALRGEAKALHREALAATGVTRFASSSRQERTHEACAARLGTRGPERARAASSHTHGLCRRPRRPPGPGGRGGTRFAPRKNEMCKNGKKCLLFSSDLLKMGSAYSHRARWGCLCGAFSPTPYPGKDGGRRAAGTQASCVGAADEENDQRNMGARAAAGPPAKLLRRHLTAWCVAPCACSRGVATSCSRLFGRQR